MTWEYRIIEEEDSITGKYFALVEYVMDEELGDGWTEPLLVGDSKEDIHRQLLRMLMDTL